ncbi:MAG: alpha-2-macroglobulin family protein [Polyangia bacterium]
MSPARRRLWSLSALSLLLACANQGSAGGGNAPVEKKPAPQPTVTMPKLPEVDKLVADQKLAEAVKKLDALIASEKNDDRLGYELILRTQLEVALGQFETAVARLRAATWPKAPVPSIAVELYYASALTTYVRSYGWQIGQREKIEHKAGTPLDLKTMTKDELVAEAAHAYARVWASREEVGTWQLGVMAVYLTPNTYPENIRGTLRDAITYLAVEHFADSALWSAEQSNDAHHVTLDRMLGAVKDVPLDGDAHPIEKVVAALDDLERFHVKAGRPEAALEARLERLRRLYAQYTEKAEHARLESALTERLVSERQRPWWGVGRALLAGWIEARGDRVRAHTMAVECRDAFPKTIGASQCQHVVETLEQPTLAVAAMRIDGVKRPSIVVNARNLPRVYFRAYPADPILNLGKPRDYDLFLGAREVDELRKRKPAASWSVTLPATPDFYAHSTLVTPPVGKGFWVFVASARDDFAQGDNQLHALQVSISDLVLVRQEQARGEPDLRVLDGRNGKPVEGADIEVWALEWNKGHHKTATLHTDREGHAKLVSAPGSYFLIVRRGSELSFDPEVAYQRDHGTDSVHGGTLVYTDRSVYRPGQSIAWKIVAYSGRREQGKFQVTPDQSVTVTLHDANGQEVQKVVVKTSAYGSADGRFTIPTGRLLGGWRISTSIPGGQSIRVEEYKRPTFEVSLKPPATPLSLNHPAKLKGEARYYFGLPVTSGTATYVVTREPVYPYWWGWYYFGGQQQAQTVARGKSKLGADGTFDVAFAPDAAVSADHAVSYRYAISADVTDDGGETRTAQRSYRLGFSMVEATLSSTHGFVTAGKTDTLLLRRADLDGTPRAGKGSYKVLRLRQPQNALLPAELPAARATNEFQKHLGDDDRRARFDQTYDPTRVIASWKDGEEVAHGDVTTKPDGTGSIELPALHGGAYRVRYETYDDAKQKSATFLDVLVAGDRALPLPALLVLDNRVAHVGDTMRLLVQSGLADEPVLLETLRAGDIIERRWLTSPHEIIERKLTEADRGGLAFSLVCVRDHQSIERTEQLSVPWDNQSLKLAFSTFRDTMRPGAHETFRVTVKGQGKNAAVLSGGAELLAYMYDRSLDLFAPHNVPQPLSLFPDRTYVATPRTALGPAHETYLPSNGFRGVTSGIQPTPDQLHFIDGYGIGGMGMRGYGFGGGGHARAESFAMAAPAPSVQGDAMNDKDEEKAKEKPRVVVTRNGVAPGEPSAKPDAPAQAAPAGDAPLRSNFAETAFWKPMLVLDSKGEASFDFVVPDSVTSWNVWVHAVTKDLRSGSIMQQTRSVKDLMVRPYLPRFLREGDKAALEMVVNNAGKTKLEGTLSFDIQDPATQKSRRDEFGVTDATRPFSVEPGKSAHVAFLVTAPKKIDTYAFVVRATAKVGQDQLSDGELRPVPVLPSRLHLTQSRFVTLHDADRREMKFADLAKNDDPSRVNEQMVVTLDAQLFYTVLRALPYLIDYPYECAEQTLNRFVSTGIVSSLFAQYPAVAKMADQMSKRTTQLQPWDAGDANRKMQLEEAPFLAEANGSMGATDPLINALDRRIALANRDSALDRLRKMQTAVGAFPWFPGGPPSPFMTLYILQGFARAAEFKVEVPKAMVQRGWQYMAAHFRTEYAHQMMKNDCCWEFLTMLNYVAGSYPDESWTAGGLTAVERKQILDFTFRHWRDTSPRVKGLLALTLFRMGRKDDAKKVFASVMDSAKVTQDRGTYWAPEDASWLWYNDTTESEAFALRVLMEIDPHNPKKDGLVLWLLLDKKLNQWKSTRATAEVLYSLAKYMTADGSLGVTEAATVSVGGRQQTYTFEPDHYVGKVQMIIPGNEVGPKSADVVVEKKTKGTMFASATWSFATDRLPTEGSGDFFHCKRTYFRRENDGHGFVLKPLADGAKLSVGDELEVQLDIESKHDAEYVHLRDPRGAGMEPVSTRSHWGYDLGLSYYEEVRDSGENFFFERLPTGAYTFKYRVRAATAGTFRVGPATLQSMYAPEFNAYSAGHILEVGGAAAN